MNKPLSLKLSVPAQSLDALTLCEATVADLSDWVSRLPMANTDSAADQLDKCVSEVAQLRTTASDRLELLEVMRPVVHYITTRLDQSALSQSHQSEQLAAMAQRLQACLTDGYLAGVRDLLVENEENGSLDHDLLAEAIHRAISDLSRQLLRTLQIYVQPPPEVWLKLNQLYLLAEQVDIADASIEDSENHNEQPLSIAEVYLRQLLLSCCKPNQLRHRHLGRIFNALEHWVGRAFVELNNDDALFEIDLNQDMGPVYRALKKDMTERRSIRTDVLVYELDAYLRDIDSSIPIPDFIDNELIAQLAGAWGNISTRSHRRLPSEATLMVSVGLRNIHFFLSGGVAFTDQAAGTEELMRREINPFLDAVPAKNKESNDGDSWDEAVDVRFQIPENPNIADPESILVTGPHKDEPGERQAAITEGDTEAEAVSLYRYYRAQALDTSPSGYRLEWPERLPAYLQIGELLAVREEADERWCIAVVRWISQQGDVATIGVELIAPKAIPVAARVVQKRGGPTEYARALLLPELKAINQEAQLITPRVPFTREQKIHLHRQGIQNTAQLLKLSATTECFNQFTFRLLDGYLENDNAQRTIQDLTGIAIEPVS